MKVSLTNSNNRGALCFGTRNRCKPAILAGLCLLLTAMSGNSALAWSKIPVQLVITGAEPDLVNNTMIVSGENFGDPFKGTVTLYVPTVGAFDLTVTAYDPDTGELLAELPAGMDTMPGSFLLKVSTGKAQVQNDTFVVSIGGQGPAGPEGPMGLEGPMGPEGPMGLQGDPGPMGPEGPMGSMGLQGEQGPAGPEGPMGPQGDPGPMGPQGDRGPQGDQGPQGIQGIQGEQGVAGPIGPQGDQGQKGDPGDPGIPPGLNGTSIGDLITWDGTNWVAQQPAPAGFQTATISHMQPYTTINFSIALFGIFPSRDSADPFVGEIGMFGFNFPPRGWALCNGQLLSIAQNTALFALLGTTYGGDGRTTFGLPDLRGRVPMHFGQGPGLQERNLGEQGGTETEQVITIPL